MNIGKSERHNLHFEVRYLDINGLSDLSWKTIRIDCVAGSPASFAAALMDTRIPPEQITSIKMVP